MATSCDKATNAEYLVVPSATVLRVDCVTGRAGTPAQADIVFYHGSNCPDGFAAAFAAWLKLRDGAQYVPVEHPLNEAALPDVAGKHVVVVDYAFNAAVSKRMLAQAASFVVLDHHASAVKELEGVPAQSKVLEMMMSGCTLSWCYFHADKPVPLFFRYLEDKDIWRWAYKGSEAFTAAYSALKPSFDGLEELLAKGAAGVDALIERGEVILAYKNGVRDSHVKRAVPCTLLGEGARFKARVVNASTLASEIGNQICKDGAELAVVWCAWQEGQQRFLSARPLIHPRARTTPSFPPFSLPAAYDHSKRHYYVSLRSDSDAVDVSILAKALGGGGHRRASGFTCESLEDVLLYEDGAPVGGKRESAGGGAGGHPKRQRN